MKLPPRYCNQRSWLRVFDPFFVVAGSHISLRPCRLDKNGCNIFGQLRIWIQVTILIMGGPFYSQLFSMVTSFINNKSNGISKSPILMGCYPISLPEPRTMANIQQKVLTYLCGWLLILRYYDFILDWRYFTPWVLLHYHL